MASSAQQAKSKWIAHLGRKSTMVSRTVEVLSSINL